MFTGLIDHCGDIIDVNPTSVGLQLCVDSQYHDCELGESVSVNGICLTVTNISTNKLLFDLSPETLSVTNASTLAIGERVNLERAMSAEKRFGGHIVLGHIDSCCRVTGLMQRGAFLEVQIGGVTANDRKFLIAKGSVTVNGVSLTINTLTDDGFGVMLIPKTLQLTNLSTIKLNDSVNIEFDYLAKVIAQQVELYQKSAAKENP